MNDYDSLSLPLIIGSNSSRTSRSSKAELAAPGADHVSKLKRERLPTNTTTRNHSVHRWYNFIAGFSPEFVSECIGALPSPQHGTLLDPFSGCGTAQVEGLRHGMDVVGYEPHPIFFKIAQAKTSDIPISGRLQKISAAIRAGFACPIAPSILGEKPEEFLKKLFDECTLSMLVGARQKLQKSDLRDDDLAFLILSRVLDYTSHSQTDGIYKAPTSRKQASDPTAALEKIISLISEDTEQIDLLFVGHPKRSLYNSTSENMSELDSDGIDIVVTSPPYLNNFDFAEMTRMHLYFWSLATSWGEITDLVRSRLIVNTTTALRGHKSKQLMYKEQLPLSLHDETDDLIKKLREMRKVRAGKKEYDYLILPYFAQMNSCLKECLRVMKTGAHFHMMVGDAALYGVHIPAPQIISHLMEVLGFRLVHLNQVRTRGERWILDKREGSQTGLGEYHISAVK